MIDEKTVVHSVPEEEHIGQRKPRRSRARARSDGATSKPRKPPPPQKGKRKPIKEDKTRRVHECMRLMATGLWVPGLTALELSKKWDLGLRAVEADASEASRRIREGIMLDEDLKASVVATLQDIAASAETIAHRLRMKQPRTSIEALRTKLEAVKAMAGVAGVESAKKVQVGGNLGDLIGLAFSDPTPQG